MTKKKFFIKVLRTSIATVLLLSALTFIVNAITSWNTSPSVTTGTYCKMLCISKPQRILLPRLSQNPMIATNSSLQITVAALLLHAVFCTSEN